MSITQFDGKFGQTVAQVRGEGQSKKDLPKAQIWMNIGYQQPFTNPESQEEEVRFISLPQGLPIDTMEKLEEKGNSDIFRAIRNGQNNLLDQIIAKGKTLQPGEEVIIAMGENGLAIQLRRVKAEQAPIDPTHNPLVRQLSL